MTKITKIKSRQILDSRGNPTIEVEVSDGKFTARADVPSGASTGIHEAWELRDENNEIYMGKGVLQAVENINNEISREILAQNFSANQQAEIDNFLIKLDGTENKSRLGANAILGISLAVARLAAMQKNIPLWKYLKEIFGGNVSLPRPRMNILNGGEHADNGIAIQEFMVMPKLKDFSANLRAGAEIFHHLKAILKARGLATSVGDEGGFAPNLKNTDEAFEVIIEAISKAGYKLGDEIELAIDAAASEFYKDGKYEIDGQKLSAEELVNFYEKIIAKYPMFSIEDSHSEDDFDGFAMMQEKFGNKIQLVGDDLFVTNEKRLQIGIEKKLANSILIKVNQIGSLTETFTAIKLAKDNNFTTVISHRSGETEDSFIADLAVGVDAGQIKTGSLSRSERICKYNQLLRISEEI
jgi:enolase